MRSVFSNTNKGFTLVELLIATAIFAFVMSGILLMLISCASLDEANREKSIATIHAETAMENIRSQGFATIQANYPPGGTSYALNLTGLNITNPLTNENINFTTQYCCDSTGNPNCLNCLNITVNVLWLDKGQRNRNLTLGTSISK